jgi:hypothetical protein
MLPILVFIFLE